MIETLYKTKTPEKERSECYVLVLASRPASEDKAYVFMEEHGRWDDELDRFIHEIKTINTEDKLTHEEGLAMFDSQRRTSPSVVSFMSLFRSTVEKCTNLSIE